MSLETHAIVIGIDGYAFSPLASAVNDAVAFRDALTGSPDFALTPVVRPEHVKLLASPAAGATTPVDSAPATYDAILTALEPYYRDSDPVDRLIVFFAGHGMVASPDGRVRETLLLPADTTGPENGRNMLSLDTLRRLFAERGPRQQLWIVDACRDMPYQRRPRVPEIEWLEEPPQGPRRHAALFSVAQGGQALSEAGGHGRFTGHLLDGLRGAGSAKLYVPGRGWCVTAQSLHEYAQKRIRASLEGFDDWTRTVQTPQFETVGGEPIDPLRDLPPPPRKSFVVSVKPPEAAAVVEVRLEIQTDLPVPGWPSEAPPGIYELRAALKPDADDWGTPYPSLQVVDLREKHEAEVTVPERRQPLPGVTAATTGERGIARARVVGRTAHEVSASKPLLPTWREEIGGNREEADVASPGPQPRSEPARLTVRALDPGARVLLRPVGSLAAAQEAPPDMALTLSAGAWDVLVRLGRETIAATRVLLAPGEEQEVAAVAQITPATAALLGADIVGGFAPADAPEFIMPSESIGPMQGAILPTLLPLLAVKPFDAEGRLLSRFGHLGIPKRVPARAGVVGLAMAVDGPRATLPALAAEGFERIWQDPDGRVATFAGPVLGPRDLVRLRIGDRAVAIAAPTLPEGITALTITAWPDGRLDGSISIFRLPLGASWDPDDHYAPPGAVARAIALASRAYQAGTNLEETSHELVNRVAYAKWLDPVLGALAFHAREARLVAEAATLHPDFAAHLREMREIIRRNMNAHFGALPDARIIAAMHPEPTARQAALSVLLDDPALGQPALTASLAALAQAAARAGRDDHWAAARLDQIAPGQVFNLAWE